MAIVQANWSVFGGYYPDAIIRYVSGVVTSYDADWVLCQTNNTEWRLAIGNAEDSLHYSDVAIYTLTSDTSGYKVSSAVSADNLVISNNYNHIFYGTLTSDFTEERQHSNSATPIFGIVCIVLLALIYWRLGDK